jgi:polyisoprenoid-binding protein YceI
LGKLNSVASAGLLAAAFLALVSGSAGRLAMAAEPVEHTHVFDLQHSRMTVSVGKQGIFAFAADNHAISAPLASGSFDDTTHAVELSVDATKMQVLDPNASSGQRAKVQANMLGPDVLDVKSYPVISFRSGKVEERDASHWVVTGNLTLHGQTHPIGVQVAKLDALHFSGSATVRQSAFGITPLKVAGGMVKVKDDVEIQFEIALAH